MKRLNNTHIKIDTCIMYRIHQENILCVISYIFFIHVYTILEFLKHTMHSIFFKWSNWASFPTDLTSFQFYMILISNNCKTLRWTSFSVILWMNFQPNFTIWQINTYVFYVLFDEWIHMFFYKYNIVYRFDIFFYFTFHELSAHDQSLLHDICVDF